MKRSVCGFLFALTCALSYAQFFYTPDLPAMQQGAEESARKRQAQRREEIQLLVSMGESAARNGNAYNQDEWRLLAQEVFGWRNMPPDSLLETLRTSQNAAAARNR